MSLTTSIFRLERVEMLGSTKSLSLKQKWLVVMENRHSAETSIGWGTVLTSSACCHAILQPLDFIPVPW